MISQQQISFWRYLPSLMGALYAAFLLSGLPMASYAKTAVSMDRGLVNHVDFLTLHESAFRVSLAEKKLPDDNLPEADLPLWAIVPARLALSGYQAIHTLTVVVFTTAYSGRHSYVSPPLRAPPYA